VADAPRGAPTGAITFSELSYGTSVGDEYLYKGIRFGGDDPYITSDSDNPTSPVLTGSPRFRGAIRGWFVRPNTRTATTVNRFSLDVGYIDTPNSVRVFAYGTRGQLLGGVSPQRTGVVRLTVSFPGTASFQVRAIGDEPAGFAIDNLLFFGSNRLLNMAALGDSYSSGEANGPFDAGSGDCHRSPRAWPRLVRDRLPVARFRHIACSGATTNALYGPFKGETRQLTQLLYLPQPSIVTVTIGGNNVGFSAILRTCFVWDCRARLQEARADIDTFGGRAWMDLAAIRRDARGGRVVVVGYPRLFPADHGVTRGCGWLESHERSVMNDLTQRLNGKLRLAAQRAGVEFVATWNALSGHELCTSSSWMYPIGLTGGDNRGHPTASGQRAMADIVRRYLGY
jgi:lysophospholipase L1-like esterase